LYKTYKKLYERRKKMKRNYNKARLPQYLLSSGFSLIAAHLNSGREEDPKKSSAPRADVEINENKRSTWREEIDDDGLESDNEINNDDPCRQKDRWEKEKKEKRLLARRSVPHVQNDSM
jgi:hypothetical protein